MQWTMVFGVALLVVATSAPFFGTALGEEVVMEMAEEPYFLPPVEKRACVRRGGNCDYRPNDCCFSSSCLCNLWGTNCRCQRMGLFQRWGK